MGINKKKAVTLFALTLLIVALVAINLNVPPSATITPEQPIYLHGPGLKPIHMNSNITLTPIHMHSKNPYMDHIYEPICTDWHELYPNYCADWHLTSWNDTGEPFGELSPNDQIDMTDEYGNITWFHVDRTTVTLNLSSYPEPFERIFVELKTPSWEPYMDPTCTLWHEVWSIYSNVYHCVGWIDNNGDNIVDFCDCIDLNDTETGIITTWHVDGVNNDLILRWKMMDPICTWWHEIYPDYCRWYHLTSWEDGQPPGEPGYGMLSPCDQIDMIDEDKVKTWYHVERVTLTLNVTFGLEPIEWMKLELKTKYFEEMYEAFKHPLYTLWHEVYPNYCNVYNLTWWDPMDLKTDNCNGVLDPCDHIWLLNMTSEEPVEELYHIVDMSYDIILTEKMTDPVCTDWHALYPPEEYCNWYHIDDWEDNGDGLLSRCDQITMTLQGGTMEEYHVENVTITLLVSDLADPSTTKYIEFVIGDAPVEDALVCMTKPVNTPWHEVYPEFCSHYELTSWEDNCNGVLDVCDYVELTPEEATDGTWYHVDEVAIDMIVKKKVVPVHDVAVVDVFSLYPWVYQGEVDPINVTVENQGNQIETVDVYAFYGGNLAAPKQAVTINPGQNVTLTFDWDTTGVSPGFYTASANATIPVDDDPSDNTATGNVQEVREPPPFYWKENYTDYAPSGIPDFDQKQDAWQNPWLPPGQNWSWCGPTAVANSLWWMDSRFETGNTPPPTISDTFKLLTNYTAGIDDHDPLNVPPFIMHLAYLMDTDGQRTGIAHIGTDVFDMQAGITHYLSWTGVNPLGDVNGDGVVDQTDWNIVNAAMGSSVVGGVPQPGPQGQPWNMAADIWPVTTGWPTPGVADNIVNANDLNLVSLHMGWTNGKFYEHTVPMPDFFLIEEEVERCQDVVLLIAPYYGDERWDEGAHFVTVAGIDSFKKKIAFSDPALDAFENGLTPEGRVLPPGVPHNHPAVPPDTTHNNASLVSHDIYSVTDEHPCPGGPWSIVNYPGYVPEPGYIWQIEYAVITSPRVVEVCGVNITDVVPSVDQAYQLWTIQVNVTVHNNGTIPINCTVTAYYNASAWYEIGTQPITDLAPCNTTTLTFNWNLTGVPICNRAIKANVTCSCGVSDEFVNGQVKVKKLGDVNNDGTINVIDIILCCISMGPVTPANVQCDINGDGTVNVIDIIMCCINMGSYVCV